MKRTNSQLSQLFIALNPNEEDMENKNFQRLCDATSTSLNVSYKKQDSNYFCNEGETTSIITGRSYSLSVSIDYDPTKESHKYLKRLLIGSVNECNNQWIQLELRLDEDSNTITTLQGKSSIQFKSMPPNGNPDELSKLEFDIFPQDERWNWGTK